MWGKNSNWKICTFLVALMVNEFTSGIVAQNLQCHVCSSDNLEACSVDYVQNEVDLPVETCSSSVASCFTKVENGITYRGCISQNHDDSATVNCDDTNHCVQCHSDKCNGYAGDIDFNPFQEEVGDSENSRNEKFTCISCDSAIDKTCGTNSTFESFEDCGAPYKCYHYIKKINGFHKRGCTKNLHDGLNYRWLLRLCEVFGEDCQICVGSNCNSAKSLRECLHCTIADRMSCVNRLKNVQSKTCKTNNDDCYTYVEKGGVSRGCVSDEDIPSDCLQNPDKCTVCKTDEGNNCNNQTFFAEQCVECDTQYGHYCKEKPDIYQGKVCTISTNPLYNSEGCYLRVEGDHVKRGCVIDLNPETKTSCTEVLDNCKSCTGPNCNRKREFTKCFKCNSKDDITCSGNTTLTNSVTCMNYYGVCLTYIDRAGYTHRRCGDMSWSYDFGTILSDKVHRCNEDNCNTVVYPPNRLQCYRCNGEDECNFMNSTNSLVPMPCGQILEPEQCYTYLSEDNKMYRGCLADSGEYRALCNEDRPDKNGTCVKCSETECNNVPKIKPASLSCVHCDKSENCAFGHEKATPCKSEVPFDSEESCYTHYNDGQRWAKRGCTLDDPKPSEIDGHFEVCSESECNKENVLHSKCISCESDVESECAKLTYKNSLIKQCEGTYSYEKRGCYTLKKPTTVTRGCVKDLKPNQLDDDEMTQCMGDGCNDEVVTIDRYCHVCDSKTEPKCVSEVDDSMLKRCPDSKEDFGCFHSIKDTRIMRGCVADLEGDDKENCLANDNTCKTCSRNGCNSKVAFAKCVATKGVMIADQKPKAPLDEQIFNKICKKYDDLCFVLGTKAGTVIRDCLDEYSKTMGISRSFLSNEYNATSYEVCAEPLCNDHDVQPMQCLSCDSRYDENCMNSTSSARKQCSLEIGNPSGCYHFEGDHIERGCITDLDEEKRKLCESDSETCKKCIGDICNSKSFFQKCLATDTENLNSTYTRTCKRYTDECFIHVRDNNIRRGCMSDLIESPITEFDLVEDCKNDAICEKCSDQNNCNDREVESEDCLVCSSKDDHNCKYHPEKLNSTQCPLALKQVGCYMRENGLRLTERGCMSSLDSNGQNDCKLPNGSCKMCLGNKCNQKRWFQKCIDCDSRIHGKACIDKTFGRFGRTCEEYLGECYTWVEFGNHVIRNCTGDNKVPDADTCKKNPEDCKLCSNVGNCNDEEVKSLTCVNCDSDWDPTCATNTTFNEFTTCYLSIHRPSCYHSIDAKGRHRRSCTNKSPKSQQERCEKNDDQCKVCTKNKCNNKASFERCFQCNSTTDAGCLDGLGVEHSKLCTAYEDQCYTHIGDYSITRGCLKEQNFLFQSACRDNTKHKCSICNTANGLGCNNQTIKMEYCAHCNWLRDKNCRDKPELFQNKICSEFNVSGYNRQGCWIHEKGKITKRGCITDLDEIQKAECLRQSENCKTCFGNNCNLRKTLQQCYVSDGEMNLDEQSNQKVKTCKHHNDACFILINHGKKTVIKGCLSEYAEENNLPINFLSETYNRPLYSVCSESLCNDQTIRATNCISCDSRYDRDCRRPFSLAWRNYAFFECPIEMNPSGCYHFEGNHTQRGCIADLKPHMRKLCESDCDTCKKCMGNECNDKAHFQKCISDDQRVADVSKSKICKRYLDECYTRAFNDTIQRGCTSDLAESPGNNIDFVSECQNGRCKICHDRDNCNDLDIENEYCLVCRDNVDCANNPTFDMRQRCPSAMMNMGCFLHNYTNQLKSNFVERGCMSKLNNENWNYCKEGNFRCKMCTGDSCNIKKTFQTCYICDSLTDPKCIDAPWDAEEGEITCANYMGECYTHLNNGIVKRNCVGDETVPDRAYCINNPDKCLICSGERSCNDNVVKFETCISCDSSVDPTCATNSTFGSFEDCPLSIHPQTCYHHIDKDTGVHKRGCIKKLQEPMLSLCQQNGAECKICIGSNCNVQRSFKQCIHCSTTEDGNCAENPIKSHTKICKQYDDECFTQIGRSDVSRGCLNERSMEFIQDCRENPDKCGICTANEESICNNKSIKMFMCNECSFEDGDEDCPNRPDKYKDKICSGMNTTKDEGCYVYKTFLSGIKRGCVRDVKGHLKSLCLQQSEICKMCIGKNCNSMTEFRRCYFDRGEKPAAVWTKGRRTCKKFDDKCFTLVNENETVIKGCLSDFTEKNNVSIDFYAKNYNASVYQECSSTLCNSDDIEPLWCIGCDSRLNQTCFSSAFAIRQRCPLEVISSGCYHHYDGKHVKRGCIAHLDKEERVQCESDSDECKKCFRKQCNREIFFLHCITTNPMNASDSQSKLCRRYTDECFTHVSNETVRKGCISDIIDSKNDGINIDIKDCDNDEICVKCSGDDNCNGGQVKHEQCIVCSTATKKDCRYYTKGLEKECPLTAKRLGCYLNVDENDVVERGCMSQLLPEKRKYCRASNGTCKSCMGENCNEKRHFQTCNICDSEVDGENCLSAPWQLERKVCPNYLDHCYTHLENGRVRRNCIGDKTVPDVDICEFYKANCKHCTNGYGCNDEIIVNESCVSCSSTIDPTCATNITFAVFEECPLSINSNRCYHMINATTGEHRRGCLEKLSKPMIRLCEKNGEECKVCPDSKCNTRTTFLKCLNCTTSDGLQCATKPQHAESKVCRNYDDECYTHIGQKDVSRGCALEKPPPFIDRCRSDPNKCNMCDTFDGNGCNNQTIKIGACVECDSLEDPSCRDKPHQFKDSICTGLITANMPGCYLSTYGGRIRRGCNRDLIPFQLNDCRHPNNDKCKTCEGRNCNLKNEFQECIYCNSRENIECSRNGTVQTSHMCENYLDTCVTGIDAHGHTQRRCSRSFDDDAIEFPNEQFEVCRDNKCNTNIFPSNRLQCYSCEGNKEDCDFMPSKSTEIDTNSKKLVPCGILSKLDQCFAFLAADNKIYRGCMTDTNDHRLLCEKDKKGLCLKCGETGCNNMARIRPPSLSCVHCGKSAECSFGQDEKDATQCKTNVPFGAEESCYTQYSLDGSLTERGCTLDAKKTLESLQDTEKISFCSETGCNDKNIKQSQCVACKSGFDGQCAKISDVDSLIKQCKGKYSHEKRGCYTMLKNEMVHRGCIKDLSKDDYATCQNKENCELCMEDNCNIDAAGSSGRITGNFVVIAFIICITFLFYRKFSTSFSDYLSSSNEQNPIYLLFQITVQVLYHRNLMGKLLKAWHMALLMASLPLCISDDSKEADLKAFTCITCDSTFDPTCGTNSTFKQFEYCEKTFKCFHIIQPNESHKRGCTKNLSQHMVDVCEKSDEECRTCVGENCNSKSSFQEYLEGDTEEANDGFYEIDKEESCVACNSAIDPKCATNTTFEVFETCPMLVNSNRCYHMINATTGEHTRGCLKNLPESTIEFCAKNSEECKVCHKSNCNSRLSFTKCLKCTTFDDRQCAINPELAPTKGWSRICENYDDQCFTYIERFGVSRGCKLEKEPPFIDNCQNDPNKCEICNTLHGFGCNDRIITMETCVECDSDTDMHCYERPHEFQDKVCSGLETEDRLGCYLQVNGNKYKRGCIRDLPPLKRDICKEQTAECKSCMGKNCNLKKEFQECIYCNSRGNIECSQHGIEQESCICKNYLSSCVTGIDAHGFTQRRCSRVYADDAIEFPKAQQVCTKNKCNTGIFPSNRLQCHRCEGDIEDCDFMSSNSTELDTSSPKLMPCGILSKFDQCFAYLAENKKIYRGCLTDISDHRLLCEKDKKGLCLKCGETGCNNVAKIRSPSLSCIHCNKSAECAFGHEKKTATQCKTDVQFGAQESCYIHYSLNGSWAERGCTLDKTNNLFEYMERTESCHNSGCNYKNIIYSKCVSCQSGFDGGCVTIYDNDLDSVIEECQGQYSYDKRGCYTMLKNETVHRGCIKNLKKGDYEACQNKENCELCMENGCNIHIIGSSGRITGNLIVIVFLLSIIFPV
ncbi:uncharacterized protein LOC129573299 [Sitodiplosis mosellana]|uniref:uncharacterized protein LOC129573299 n=1 Tax=Sitodiplosis mosellana TaxID=263140 RepID=UPI00244498C2|nr:uncharacterized protein LOC129573299 [Sitodiplosis mosellana]